ncbi:hypothetical protein [Elioraea sp.]|uniref:hypothetical protein n=1 Tax=Elioraea sp. TaxID=2185103 RepID=UPI0025C3278C|nr:hypothetical protein [Elioraea sp.]
MAGLGVLIVLAALPAHDAHAQAPREASPPELVFRWLADLFGPYAAAALIFLALPAAGFLGKWVFDEVKAANAKRRDFVAKTSDKVVGLAWDHYWALANATGTLAGHLNNHLRLVDAHLLVVWDDPKAMQERMRAIAGDTEGESFVSFVRLLHAFERFQFRGSNTYLLPHHAAGEALRRLYNRFIGSLGTQMGRSLTPIRLAIERKLVPATGHGEAAKPPDLGSAQFETKTWFTIGDRLAAADWNDAELQERLDTARARYRTWLATEPAAVAEAADSLHAFSRLLTHELAVLHAVWHHDRGPMAMTDSWRQVEAAVASRAWPGVLDDRAAETVRRARSVSSYFAPLGGIAEAPPAERTRQGGAAPAQPGRGPEQDRMPGLPSAGGAG